MVHIIKTKIGKIKIIQNVGILRNTTEYWNGI